MKEQADWNNQEKVDEAADAELAERPCGIEDLKAYWVAKRLGASPGGGLYAMVEDWRERRQSESRGAEADIVVPLEAEAEQSAAWDRAKADGMAAFVRAYRKHAAQVEGSSAAQRADFERKLTRSEEKYREILALCKAAEQQRDAALAEIDELQVSLLEAGQLQARLDGRIEQLTLELRVAQQSPANA